MTQFTIVGMIFFYCGQEMIQYRSCKPVPYSACDFYVNSEVFFQVKRTMDVHIEVYTIITGRPCTCVLIPLLNICYFSVIFKVWYTIIFHYLQKTAKYHFLKYLTVHKCYNTHIYKHNWLSVLYGKAKQRVSSLNTFIK